MIFVCSVVLADKAFTLQFAGKMLSLSAGDVLLIDDTDREDFQPHAAHITEVRLDENIIRRYLESCGGNREAGFAPIFPDTCYHLTHYWPAAADIPVASDNPVHYADAIRYNARTPLQGSLLPLTRLV